MSLAGTVKCLPSYRGLPQNPAGRQGLVTLCREGKPQAAPVPTGDADRDDDLLERHGGTPAHVAVLGLHQEVARGARCGHAGAVLEEAAVAAIGGIPERFVRLLRPREFRVVGRQIGLEIDRGTKHDPGIDLEDGLLDRRQHAIGPCIR
jgi:hypothetical protein